MSEVARRRPAELVRRSAGLRGFPRGRGEGGFTLLEVVVSLTILAAGFVGLLAMLSGSLRLSGASRDVSVATVYASQLMEEALLAPDPAAGVESAVIGGRYRWVKRTSLPAAEEGHPFQPVVLEVSILWYDGRQERSVALAATRWDRKDSGG